MLGSFIAFDRNNHRKDPRLPVAPLKGFSAPFRENKGLKFSEQARDSPLPAPASRIGTREQVLN